MADSYERLTPEAVAEYADAIGLALLAPGEQVNALTEALDRICREHREMRDEIARLKTPSKPCAACGEQIQFGTVYTGGKMYHFGCEPTTLGDE